ncbi:unnamed protein product [Bursaphelenchus okinawaensis]|uniref:Uncharacterized protein n=1 Tax=Bursaphelenchus okinawaensis TaxID=465554 RepID=A0A811KZ79_9BILA|nr:unnamed protein product [Bursaphelenchus okinawaensis]CAG9114109.1 unnamed protein product [Bursaphelenchus okinawaensis]
MATTIQDCASLSAFERRERRKQKILANAESRLEKLLTGQDGAQRAAPGIDGAPAPAAAPSSSPTQLNDSDCSIISASSVKTAVSASSTKTALSMSSTKTAISGTTVHTGLSPDSSRFDDSLMDETMNTTNIEFVLPTYWDFVDRNRVYLVIFMGLLMTVCSQYGVVDNIVYPIVLVQLSYEIFMFKSRKTRYPRHGYVVNTLLAAGLDDNIVVNAGILLDIGWDLVADMVLISFVFVASHAALNGCKSVMQMILG